MTWAYRDNVLDLEPHGPLPTQIYWRRRGLALAVGLVVIGIVVAVAVTVLTGNAGSGNKNSAKPANTPAAAADLNPQPEVKSPITPLPPAARPNPNGHRGCRASAGAQGRRRLPGFHAGR